MVSVVEPRIVLDNSGQNGAWVWEDRMLAKFAPQGSRMIAGVGCCAIGCVKTGYGDERKTDVEGSTESCLLQ